MPARLCNPLQCAPTGKAGRLVIEKALEPLDRSAEPARGRQPLIPLMPAWIRDGNTRRRIYVGAQSKGAHGIGTRYLYS
jgi:hypothetical protein